jgi:hypothetical protein
MARLSTGQKALMVESLNSRRRLAILRRLQSGPATWRELVEAVGPISYGVSVGDVSTLNGDENNIRYSVNRDVAWLRKVGCDIPFRRGKPGEGRYALRAAPVEMAEPLRLDEAQEMALSILLMGVIQPLAQVDDHKTQVDLANTLLEMDAIRLDTIAELPPSGARHLGSAGHLSRRSRGALQDKR